MNMAMRLIWGALRLLLNVIVALLILFEEWGWEPLQRAMAWLGRAPVLRHAEAWVARLSPAAALVALLVPMVALVPVKLGAVWLIGNGKRMLGLALIIAAKVIGTAVVARIFALTKPALMSMPWFASFYATWLEWKGALVDRVRTSWAWRGGRELKRLLRVRWLRLRAAFARRG